MTFEGVQQSLHIGPRDVVFELDVKITPRHEVRITEYPPMSGRFLRSSERNTMR